MWKSVDSRGGMGTVYSASDIELERGVAVKVIREDLVGSAEAAERFRQRTGRSQLCASERRHHL